eukprot:5884719-Prymnesium_polylepis.2
MAVGLSIDHVMRLALRGGPVEDAVDSSLVAQWEGETRGSSWTRCTRRRSQSSRLSWGRKTLPRGCCSTTE